MVCIGTYLGFHQADFFPKRPGKSYELPYVLEPLDPFRDQFSIFSGLDHRGRNGHEGWKAWMSGYASGSVSMDQLVAAHVGDRTRYASLQVTCGSPPDDARVSYTKEGLALPMVGRPSVLFQTLFRSDSDKSRIEYVLKGNASVLDGVLEEAKSIQRQVSKRDQRKVDEYLTSLREVEKRLQKQEAWLEIPYPKSDYELPPFDPISPEQALECETIMYDLMALALTTDSTRVLTFMVPRRRMEPGVRNRWQAIEHRLPWSFSPRKRSQKDRRVQPGRKRARKTLWALFGKTDCPSGCPRPIASGFNNHRIRERYGRLKYA